MKKYPVITLCGSTRFKEEFERVQKDLTLKGYIVISVGLFWHSGDDEVLEGMSENTLTETKRMLDDMHKKKIDMAGSIFVINPGGYIGDSTWSEISYACMLGKKIEFLEDVPQHAIQATVRERIEKAEQLAMQNLDYIRHQDGYVDLSQYPCFKHKGRDIYDPWISVDAHYDGTAFIDHDDPKQAVDPFEYYGREKTAWFVEEILARRGEQ